MSNESDKESTEFIFTTTDPLGRIVTLKSSTWNYHITDGDNNRKEFIGQEETMHDVVVDPAFILPDDPDDPENKKERYIDLVMLPEFNSLKALVVIVDHSSSDNGDVVTIIAKQRLNQESTRGGALYVRPKSTRPQ